MVYITENSLCYTFEKRNYNQGILNNFVDATYILTMDNSPRIVNINKELEKIIPTKIVYIVYNKGFKNCKKILTEQIAPYDLSDAYFNTINHSLNNNYNNILVLEDDFIFCDKINDTNILNEIKYYFKENENTEFYFNLGPIPFIFYPSLFSNTYRGYFTTVSHAIIYNKKLQENLKLKGTTNNIMHWDYFLTTNYKHYFYKFPLCYQTFPQTNNKIYWESYFPNVNLFLRYIKLDIQPEPGFTIIYKILSIIHYLILFIFMYLIYILISYVVIPNINLISLK